jgi:hypothetical protein
MTIEDLIIELNRRRRMHGAKTVVRVTWEGVIREIDLSNIYFTNEDKWTGLWIDADYNSYKPKDAV